jgi:hypothetical protein
MSIKIELIEFCVEETLRLWSKDLEHKLGLAPVTFDVHGDGNIRPLIASNGLFREVYVKACERWGSHPVPNAIYTFPTRDTDECTQLHIRRYCTIDGMCRTELSKEYTSKETVQSYEPRPQRGFTDYYHFYQGAHFLGMIFSSTTKCIRINEQEAWI